MSQVHFEIFRRQAKSGEWALVEAIEDRDVALTRARKLLKEGRALGVRVIKETFNPDSGDYMSLTIFEDGDVKDKPKSKTIEDINVPPPCLRPEDLYSYYSRQTLSRLIADWLARQQMTATELMHNAQALEKLEATDTTYQHAIQKVAVAQAAGTDVPVTQIVKKLNELCTAAMHRIYKEEKRGSFPALKAGEFGPLAESLAGKTDDRYFLNGVLAKYLAGAKGWDAKLKLVLALMAEVAPDGLGRKLLLSAIDALVAEMLTGSAALADLLGHNADLGQAILNLVGLFLGTEVHRAEGTGGGVNDLARYFATDELPEARAAIAGRILLELKSSKRLCPDSLEEELKMLRLLANQLVRGQGKYLSHEDLIAAFTGRSKRLVSHESLHQFMQSAKTPDEKVERLLTVEENLIGAENKRKLSTFIVPIIASNGFEDQLCAGGQVPQRLKRAAELQDRVQRSGFQEIEKNQISNALDAVAVRIDDRAKFLASIETRMTNPVERAHALLKLCLAGVFTKGELTNKAKRMVMASLAKPGFLSTYFSQVEAEKKAPIDREAALAEFAGQLERIGIPHEDALRAFAA